MEHISVLYISLFLMFLIVLSGFFSSSEIGMMSINRYRLRHLVKKKNRAAVRVQSLLSRPDRLLGVILIGNTFANIVSSAVMTILCVRVFGEIGVLIGTIVLTLVILIFAEVAPKTVAAIYPQKVAFLVSMPLQVLLYVLSPLVWLASAVSNSLLRMIGIKVNMQKQDHLSHEELRTVVHEAGSLIPSDHKDMLVSILDLGGVTVNDIMIPRNEIIGIDLNEEWDEVFLDLQNSQHTRLPIYHDSIDNVKGIVHMRSVSNLMATDRLSKETLESAAEEAYFVPESTTLSNQLVNFKTAKCRSALVVDEYGELIGLVTLEDILEEIVGEFTTDIATLSKDIHPQEDGSYMIDGGCLIRELNRDLGWGLPTDGPKTLSGVIIEHLEAIPSSGVSVKIAGHPIEIIQVKDNKIKTVKIFASNYPKSASASHADE